MEYYKERVEDIYKELKTSPKGLTEEEANKRFEKYGPNEIKAAKKISPARIFLSQFKSVIIWMLIAAVAISVFLGERIDAAVISAIVVMNSLFGFFQEYRAEKSIEALKRLASLTAVVVRDGERKQIPARDVVPGDIIELHTGEKIPADARIIEEINLETQESSLTGESTPVEKNAGSVKEAGLGDQKNMVFSGTIITKGRGLAAVVRTGMDTEIGKIARMIEEAEEELTPLQKKMDQLGKLLAIGVIIVCAIVFIFGIMKNLPIPTMFKMSVSLAVAIIPEGLPAIVTIGLALGVQKMVRRHALIRRLPSVETLGSTTVICTDKTGTLTCNEMTVKKIYLNEDVIEVSGEGYSTEGSFSKGMGTDLKLLLEIGALCNDSAIKNKKITGDPTEVALLVSAEKASMTKEELESIHPRIYEVPFSSERKFMTTLHKGDGKNAAYCKGAADVILKSCNKVHVNGKLKPLGEQEKKEILKVNEKFASEALRVLGFAYRYINKGEISEKDEKDFVFVGLQAMMDPPRKEVREAISKCKKAGIRVIMITGDHKLTAMAIAKEIGIEGLAMTGEEIDKTENLSDIIEEVAIYARVSPEHKVKIVDALKSKGEIVAMTGDGINDAPALKKADMGISMGITGTDVAKEASSMILTDDNFASIVNAVEEGRTIYDNIKKSFRYLLSGNLGGLLVVFIGIIIAPQWLPLIAAQILWINLLMDGFPALALGVEPAEPDVMKRSPIKPKERIVSNNELLQMIVIGVTIMLATLFIFYKYEPGKNLAYAQTMAFSTIVMARMFNAMNSKSEYSSVFKVGWFSNRQLILAIMSSISLQMIAVYALNGLFGTVPLTLFDWILIMAVSSSVLVVGEIYKLAAGRIMKKK